MPTPREKFQDLLRELFQFDAAELDFGIYRIMNHKRAVIERFIEKDLLDAVSDAFKQGAAAEQDEARWREAELRQEVIENLGADALDAEGNLIASKTSPLGKRYLEARELAKGAKSTPELESAVFNHLHAFFSRYYTDGDFMSLRRYSRREKYAIPYNGEEVYLHWANSDQYYIKSGENFTDYSYRHGGWTIAFKLRNADVEQNSVKGAKRFFIPGLEDISSDTTTQTFTIPFEFRPLTAAEEARFGKTKVQDSIIAEAVPAIEKAAVKMPEVLVALAVEKRRDADGQPISMLAHHLRVYTRKNTSDFFIHKDLQGFLERELDFYLKNEVLNVDELEAAGESRAQGWFQLLRTIKSIGGRIILFLAQIENLQKRLFEKKKFVVEAHYCLTLDRIPEKLFPSIEKNKEQVEEWKRSSAVEDGNVSAEFLQRRRDLVLDTRFFATDFVDELLSSPEFLGKEAAVDNVLLGLLVESESFQAVRTIEQSWKRRISCFYSDPPFNLGENADFAYKTDYQNSTWLTLLESHLTAGLRLLVEDALVFVRCDYHGSHLVRDLLEKLSLSFKAEILIDRSRNEAGSPNKMEATYEHLFMFGLGDYPIRKFTVPRSLANIKWTGFLMAGDRSPPQRSFLGKELLPPAGQHFSLKQSKVDKLLKEFFLRVKCHECGCLYYEADSDQELERLMKAKDQRFKFYDIKNATVFHGVKRLENCVECGKAEFRVEYLGSDEVFVNENWLDIPSYSRRWGFTTENSEELLDRVTEFTNGGALDMFGGSGTTAAVALKKRRPFVLCEFGKQFDAVILPRMKQVLSGEHSGISAAHDWRGLGCFKYLRLESYEDALDNIVFEEPGPQATLQLDDYVVNYMLDFETRDSSTLLNVEMLESPFDYKLRRHGIDEPLAVDAAETFNYLIGLRVISRRALDNNGARYLVYRGKAEGRETVIIWRTTRGWKEKEFELDRQFILNHKLIEGAEDIFVNTDSFVEGARSLDPVFMRRMFNEE